VGSEDSLLRADLEKARNPVIVENEVPANLESVTRNPMLYGVLKDQEDTDQANITATAESGKLVVSEVCINPWIENVSLSMRVLTPDIRVFICACLYLNPPKLVTQKLRLLP
jgi:hypothetical protein